jgi:hypothetical protein
MPGLQPWKVLEGAVIWTIIARQPRLATKSVLKGLLK